MIEVPILYEDNHLLIVEKPVNMPAQPDSSKSLDLVTYLKQDIKERYNKPGNVYLSSIHTLDRPVGGAIAFAKTSKCAARLSEATRKNEIQRSYYAIVHGVPTASKDRLVHTLVKDKNSNNVSVVTSKQVKGKQAIINYEVIQSDGHYTLVEVHVEIGHPQQIRVQFSAIGHPLFGDQKYGYDVNKKGQQIALWSSEIICKHPTQDEMVQVYSPPPDLGIWTRFDW